MSFEEYQNFDFEDPNFKYEWNNGSLESEERIKPKEAILLKNLQTHLNLSKHIKDYEILAEMSCYLKSQKIIRIPDIGIYKYSDIKNYIQGNVFFPILAIEIISPSNQAEELELKIREYFQEGVRSVWCIYPKLKQVKVYKSMKESITCNEDDLCEFQIEDHQFSIRVNDLFKDFS
ncbi:MAG: Uma2 family endonuclease [Leptospiraceae bacterium]|nr:Uma2 family endonuclease [Leptospiraceae bacterium]